jgi:Reverse transcriptase (RNA-dependent DNA polymerase)
VAILWKKALKHCIRQINLDNRRLCGVELSTGSEVLCLISAYFPTRDKTDEIQDFIGQVISLFDLMSTKSIIIAADTNLDPKCSMFADLENACNEIGASIIDTKLLPSETKTYFSEINFSSSWIDHILVTDNLRHSVTSCNVWSSAQGDHVPICIDLNFDITKCVFIKTPTPNSAKQINWRKVSAKNKLEYKQKTEIVSERLIFNLEYMKCPLDTCNCEQHKSVISHTYNELMTSLIEIDRELGEKTKMNKSNCKCVPGWNNQVKSLYMKYRADFQHWISTGRSDIQLHETMCESRRKFKSRLRKVKRNEQQIRNDNLASLKCSGDFRKFWHEVREEDIGHEDISAFVEGVSGQRNIAELWRSHYGELFATQSVKLTDNEVPGAQHVRFCPDDVMTVVKELKLNKAAGPDQIRAEHFKYGDSSLNVLLSSLINLMISHSYIPESLLDVKIVPKVKKTGLDPRVKANYRPIALATTMSKILELVLLIRYESNLATTANQFGFKKKVGTELAIYTVKQIIAHFEKHNTPVYACFLDASKAFDKVDLCILLQKLKARKLPSLILIFLVLV